MPANQKQTPHEFSGLGLTVQMHRSARMGPKQELRFEQESETADKRAESLSLELPPEEDTRGTAFRLRTTLKREISNATVSGCCHRRRLSCLDELYIRCDSDSTISLDACVLLRFVDDCTQGSPANPGSSP